MLPSIDVAYALRRTCVAKRYLQPATDSVCWLLTESDKVVVVPTEVYKPWVQVTFTDWQHLQTTALYQSHNIITLIIIITAVIIIISAQRFHDRDDWAPWTRRRPATNLSLPPSYTLVRTRMPADQTVTPVRPRRPRQTIRVGLHIRRRRRQHIIVYTEHFHGFTKNTTGPTNNY